MSARKKVIAISADGTAVEYASVDKAAWELKCKEECIRRVLRGERKTTCGMRWEYAKS